MAEYGGRQTGRTERMLRRVARSTTRRNIIIAHTTQYALSLIPRLAAMLDDINGREFWFYGMEEAEEKTRGFWGNVYIDHHCWNVARMRLWSALRAIKERFHNHV